MAPRGIQSVADMHVRYQYDGQQCENVWQFHYNAPAPNSSDLAALVTDWTTRSMTALRALYTSAVTFNSIYARDIDPTHANANFSFFFPAGTTGTHSGSPMPGNTACSVLLGTGLAGRAHHGRKSFGPLATTDISQNELVTSYFTLMATFLATIVTTYASGKFQPVVASQRYNGWDFITSLGIPNNSVDSQKTRLTGRGR
jgi:hypothetical protein